jgi:hypothetical protein
VDAGDRYEVFCPAATQVNGVYTSKGVKNRYEQEGGGAHAMVRHSNGLWGVGDNKNYLVLADKVSESPTDITNWKVLVGGGYRLAPGTYIRHVRTAPPSPGAPNGTDTLKLSSQCYFLYLVFPIFFSHQAWRSARYSAHACRA